DTPAISHMAAAPVQHVETPIQARDTGKSSLVWVKPAIVLAALMFAGVTMWYFLGQKNERVPSRPSEAVTVSPAPTMQTTPPVSASIAKPVTSVAQPHIAPQVIEQNAQIIIFAYHRLVGKVRYPGTEITPADF